MTTTISPETLGSPVKAQIRAGFSSDQCPECNKQLMARHGLEAQVIACPDCGQCVRAPAPWACQATDWGLQRPQWPLPHKRVSGWVGISVGALISAIALVPVLNVWGRAGAVCLGLGLMVEGLNRLVTRTRERAAIRPGRHVPTPDPTCEFGALKAVFVSRNSFLDALALCCVASTICCGVAWMLSWMLGGMMHPKLILCLLVLPIAIAYVGYRSIRILADRQHMIIREHGMHVAQRRTRVSFAWTDVRCITAAHIGDMIDEDAMEIELRGSRADVRFTRAQFPDIEMVWARILQEANEQVETGNIDIQAVDRSPQQ